MTWKDIKHPQSGGAELINEEIAKRLARDGHEVILLVSGFPGGEADDTSHGYRVIRGGNRFTVYWHAYRYYKKNFVGWADLVIDEMNTIPFFCKFYVKEKNILLAYQLCREIWFYQISFPFSLVGYIFEPFYLRLLSDRSVITESESTKRDMAKYGFSANNISVIPIGITTEPVDDFVGVKKFIRPTLLSLGAIRPMKRTLDQIKAFEIARNRIPNLQLKIAGSASGKYGKEVLSYIASSMYAQDIEYLGSVNDLKKTELMQKSHLILVTSVKEGWGLIVTEANSQGTPAVVYDVDGLRDSVRVAETGWMALTNTPDGLADSVFKCISNQEQYEQMRKNAWLWSRQLTLENCYQQFLHKVQSL